MSRKTISRRDAIKLLGAATGAALLANIPSKWSKPELTSGVLPAHAQASCGPLTFTSASNQILGNSAYVSSVPGCNISMNIVVQISAAQVVPLLLQTNATGPVTWNVPNAAPDGTYNTNGSGQLTLHIDMFWDNFVYFNWSFLNASDGCHTAQTKRGCA